MTLPTETPVPAQAGPDLAAVKQRQQATWDSGDYAVPDFPQTRVETGFSCRLQIPSDGSPGRGPWRPFSAVGINYEYVSGVPHVALDCPSPRVVNREL